MSVRAQSATKGYSIPDDWFDVNDKSEVYIDMAELALGNGSSALAFCLANNLTLATEAVKASFHRTGIIGGGTTHSDASQIILQLEGEATPRLWQLSTGVIHPLSVRRIYTSWNGQKSYLRNVRIVGYGTAAGFYL